jgi:pimeloyl-ACP methyl ester carboxylesterase
MDAKEDRAARLEGFAERHVDARAVRMRYFVAGEGPPIVLVHGLTGAASNWVDVAPALAERYRVLVPDLPGHGASAPLPGAASLAAHAERVYDVCAHESMLPAALVGHSLGGLVALRLAARRPDAVTGLVLAASAGIGSTSRRAELWLSLFGFMRPGKRVEPLRGMLAQRLSVRRAVFNRWQVSDPCSLSQAAVHGLLAPARIHTDVIGPGRALVRDDPRTDLAAVRCRCLVLWGARDRQVFVDDAFEYARRLRAPLRVVPDCGHLLIAERPDVCVRAIADFLERRTE